MPPFRDNIINWLVAALAVVGVIAAIYIVMH